MKYIFSETHLHFTANYIKDINFTVRYSEGVVVCHEGVKTTNRRNQFLQIFSAVVCTCFTFPRNWYFKGTLRLRMTYCFSTFNTKFNTSCFHLQNINFLFSPLRG